MTSQEVSDSAFVSAPKAGKCITITVDSTSRSYDLGSLDWGQGANGGTGKQYYNLDASTNDVFFFFAADTSQTLVDTATIAVSGTAAFTAGACPRLIKDVPKDVYADRVSERYLYLKTASGAATVRIYLSSPAAAKSSK